MNRPKPSNNTSGFKGVSFQKKTGRWYACIASKAVREGRTIALGLYSTPEEAACAYDASARKLHGAFARLNFPEET